MASLLESYPTLRDVLMARYGRPARPAASSLAGLTFLGLLRLALSATVAERTLDLLLTRLESLDLADAGALVQIDPKELAAELASERPPLVVPGKTQALIQNLAGLVEQAGGLEPLVERSTERLRDDLRAIRGLGPGTVDAVLLHGFGRPTFPVDRPAYRVLVRHGWLDASSGYDEAREVVEGLAPDDPQTLADLAHGLERLGAEFCRAGAPRCDRCPLQTLLPAGGPIDPGA